MLEDLYKAGKITSEQFEAYVVFKLYEVGRKWCDRMLIETFMCEAPIDHMTPYVLAHLEGRRSMIRQIKLDIQIVDSLLAEENYVRAG